MRHVKKVVKRPIARVLEYVPFEVSNWCLEMNHKKPLLQQSSITMFGKSTDRLADLQFLRSYELASIQPHLPERTDHVTIM